MHLRSRHSVGQQPLEPRQRFASREMRQRLPDLLKEASSMLLRRVPRKNDRQALRQQPPVGSRLRSLWGVHLLQQRPVDRTGRRP